MSEIERVVGYLNDGGITDQKTRDAIVGEGTIRWNLSGGIYSMAVREALRSYLDASPEDRESGAWATFTNRKRELAAGVTAKPNPNPASGNYEKTD